VSTTAALVAVVAVAVGTYLTRAGLILVFADRTFPPSVERALRNVGPAVLAALVVSLAAGGSDSPDLPLPEILSLAAAGFVAWRRWSLVWSLLAGMSVLWLATALLG
jgi:branched-subunit amino acid transport protein